MSVFEILSIVAAAASSILGWFAREMWSAVKELKQDLAKLREEIPKSYVSKDDFSERFREVVELLHRIENKLDSKQDK